MGGPGSGNWRGSAKKTSVLECLRVTMENLHESGIISGEAEDILLTWNESGGQVDVASARARVTSRTEEEITLSLAYTIEVDGESHDIEESVRVLKAGRRQGGNWWFICPAENEGTACSRRAGVLYLPPGERYFACRHCHELAYTEAPAKVRDDPGIGAGSTDSEEAEDDVEQGNDRSAGSDVGEAQEGKPDEVSSPLRCSFYIDHALKQLAPDNTTLSDQGRVALVNGLLSEMVRDEMLSDQRFIEVIAEVESLAPDAFSECASRVLREGVFAAGAERTGAFFPLLRLGRILRLHLIRDLKLQDASDLLLVNAGIDAFVQAQILLSRATPLSLESGPTPREEKELRSQATAQQKLFLSALEKLKETRVHPRRKRKAKSRA